MQRDYTENNSMIENWLTSKEPTHREYMFSARTENGPVTPRIVKGCTEKLHRHKSRNCVILEDVSIARKVLGRAWTQRRSMTTSNEREEKLTYRENIIPHNPVLKTTSMVPQFCPVRTKRSLANVMPGKRLVKKR